MSAPQSGADRSKIIRFLEGLPDPDLAKVINQIEASQYDKPTQQKAERVRAILEFVESIIGCGLDSFAATLGELYPKHRDKLGLLPEPIAIPVSEVAPVLTTLPKRNPHFTGRTEQIDQLRKALTEGRSAALTQAISGLGGIGKTSLAIEYAYTYAEHYDQLLFVRADSTNSLNSGYRLLARQLALPQRDDNDDETVTQAVKHYLNTAKPSRSGIAPYLLILDNADFGADFTLTKFKHFLADSPTGHVLLTTRNQTLHGTALVTANHVLTLDVMKLGEAVTFLIERVSVAGTQHSATETHEAAALAEALGYLPLALEQAAAYIATMQTSYGSYLELYRRFALDQMEEMRPQSGDYPETVRTTWTISFREVEKAAPAAADLLRLCAFFAPNAIPMELVISAAAGAVESLTAFFGNLDNAAVNRGVYDKLLFHLTRYSLVTKNVENVTFDVHRLVQAVQREAMGAEGRQEWTTTAVDVLNQVFPSGEFDTWALCGRLILHVLALMFWVRENKYRSESLAHLLNQSGYYLQSRGRYGDAEPLHQEALQIRRESLPEGHPSIAESLNNLARVNYYQARYKEAEPLYVEALQIRREYLPESDPDIAESLNDLAVLYASQARYKEAELLYNEAVKMFRAFLPEGHPHIALSLNNLAGLYHRQGRLKEAEPLFNEAVLIRRVTLPEGHPDIALSLNALAGFYETLGRYKEAEPLYNEALQIRRESLPEGHPDIAFSLNDLAFLYHKRGRPKEAELLFNEAVKIFRASLGENHPDTELVVKNLQIFLQKQREKKLAGQRGGTPPRVVVLPGTLQPLNITKKKK